MSEFMLSYDRPSQVSLPNARRPEAQFLPDARHRALHFTVKPHQIVQNLSGPPHERIAMNTLKRAEILLGHGEWQEGRSIGEAVNNRHLDDLAHLQISSLPRSRRLGNSATLVTQRLERGRVTTRVVAPVLRVEHERSIREVGSNETVHEMVHLAAEAASFAEIAKYLLGR